MALINLHLTCKRVVFGSRTSFSTFRITISTVCVLQHILSTTNFPLFLKPYKYCVVFPICAHKSALERSSSLHIDMQTYIYLYSYKVIWIAIEAHFSVVTPANFKYFHCTEKQFVVVVENAWEIFRNFVEWKKLNCCKVKFIQVLKYLYVCTYIGKYIHIYICLYVNISHWSALDLSAISLTTNFC